MKSRHRVLMALDHRESDRIPRDLGGTESSGMTVAAYRNLCEYLRVETTPIVFEPFQYVAMTDNHIRREFGIDTVNLTPGPSEWRRVRNPLGFDVMMPDKWHEEEDASGTFVRGATGVIMARRPTGGHYFDPVNPPLTQVNDADELEQWWYVIQGFDLPFFADEGSEKLQGRAELMRGEDGCVVFNLCCHILAAGQLLRGYENFMVDLMCEKEFVKRLLAHLIEGYMRRIDALAPLLREFVDVILLNDDLGTQQGPMLSPDVYREMIKPSQKQLFEYVKKKFGKPILFHSCGAVSRFIPDLIECGVDALNPVQMTAEGMELGRLKKEFGSELTFWGGGVDTQNVLNRKTPREVKDAVKKCVDILAPGGGFVFCQVHNIQPDVPPENVVAMFEALEEY